MLFTVTEGLQLQPLANRAPGESIRIHIYIYMHVERDGCVQKKQQTRYPTDKVLSIKVGARIEFFIQSDHPFPFFRNTF